MDIMEPDVAACENDKLPWLSTYYMLGSWLLIALGLVGVGYLAVQLNAHEHTTLTRALKSRTAMESGIIEGSLASRVIDLRHMTARWQVDGGISHDAWEADASLYLRHGQGFDALE